MKKSLLFMLVVVWIAVISAQSADLIKVRQILGAEKYVVLYLHNEKNNVWQCVYDSGQLLTLGVGPSVNFKYNNGINISAFSYADMIFNLKDQDFPIQAYQGEVFIIFGYYKLSLYTRTAGLINAQNEKMYLSGRDFLGYKIGLYNVRVQAEWRETDERLITYFGPSVEYAINDYVLCAYLGVDMKSPHPKAGWLEIRYKL